MFWTNLKAIISNTPLVLSDTTDPKDISIHRITFALAVVFVIFTPLIILNFFPEFEARYAFYWEKLLYYLGGQATLNMLKRGIDAFKGGNVQ
jgi:hypothetical protein